MVGGATPYTNILVNGISLGSVAQVGLGNGSLAVVTRTNALSVVGVPGSTGIVTFTVSVTDSAGNTVGPVTYTINVLQAYTVSGQVTLLNNCSGSSAFPFYISLYPGSDNAASYTDSNGNYSISGILNGTYTLTPSLNYYGGTAGTSVFYPATQNVTVNNGNVTNANFNAAIGYQVEGLATYSGSQTGPVYLSLTSSTNVSLRARPCFSWGHEGD